MTPAEIWASALVRSMREAGLLAGFSLSAREIAVLALSGLAPKEMREVRSMSLSTGIPKPSVTRTIDALEGAGLVRRRAQPSDRRVIYIEITEAGLTRLQRLAQAFGGGVDVTVRTAA